MAIPKNKNKIVTERANNGQIRWAFILKVYSIVCLQLLLTFGVCLAMSLTHPVRDFMRTSTGLYLLLATMAITLISIVLTITFRKRRPYNYVFFFLYTLSISFVLGTLSCQVRGGVVLQASGLALLLMMGHTLYTFVAKPDLDHSLANFMFCVLIVSSFVMIFFPVGEIANHAFGSILELVVRVSTFFCVLKHFVYFLVVDVWFPENRICFVL